MSEFVKECCAIIGIILAVLGPLFIGVNIYHKNTLEFEKYKIEMQLKHGDIPINEVGE